MKRIRPIFQALEPMQTFSNLIPFAENRVGLVAAQQVADCIGSRRAQRLVNPLFVHGPAGSGKSHLVAALVHEALQQAPDLTARVLPACDLTTADDCDLLVIEDLHHLPAHAAEVVVQLFEERLARQQQLVFTALHGPGQLSLPARLVSRLASGLVVGLQTLSAASRLVLLEDQAQRRRIAVGPGVLPWLANQLNGSGRQLDGALNQLEALASLRPGRLDLATVTEHFREEADASRPTVERIARRVSGHFRVDPRRVRSQRRQRTVMLPRQVSMYLARQLTDLSLAEIGHYFGGRDHSTVLHACRTIEQALANDLVLSGTVRQLQADLA